MKAIYWARPLISSQPTKFCAVTSHLSSYSTACCGKWPVTLATQIASLEQIEVSEQCGRCIEVTAGECDLELEVPDVREVLSTHVD